MTEPTDGHDHDGAWNVIFIALVLTAAFIFGTFMGHQYQLNVLYDRVGEMQRQLDCPLGELLVIDHDGVEYCLDPAEKEESE